VLSASISNDDDIYRYGKAERLRVIRFEDLDLPPEATATPVRVVAFNAAEHWSEDASEDVTLENYAPSRSRRA
jgi:hypothetical protein